MIDWHDFVVVETVEFTDADEVLQIPPPISIMDLENMSLAQKRSKSLFVSDAPIQPAATSETARPPPGVPGADAAPRLPAPPLPTPRPAIPGLPRPPMPVANLPPRPPPALQKPSPANPSPTTPSARPYDDDGEENDAKRQKMSEEYESSLVPEYEFLAENPLPALQPHVAVSQLKEHIATLVAIPANKQKLSLPSGVLLKNNVSLAFYNLRSGDVLHLSLKDRGGKK
ncbi:hypothetical protein HDU96_004292 [Phlyctochytrium bullatum]|nr:hypothetical protein HDU96_004292 [Phlyctochytrium bullatum]